MFHQFPYTNLHEINLDWIIKRVIEAYSPDNPPENIVLSVNGQTGNVILYEASLVQLPSLPNDEMWQIRRTTRSGKNRGIKFTGEGNAFIIDGAQEHALYSGNNPPPYPVTSVNGETGEVVLFENPSVILPEITSAIWSIVRNSAGTTIGIRFANGKIYRVNSTENFEVFDAGNPPPYPVTSVNGQTGAVNITFPVTSVNGQTGAVNLQIPFVNTAPEILEFQTDSPGDYWGMQRTTTNGDVGIYFDSENNTVKAYITYMPEDESTQQPQTFQLLTTNDIPSSSGVVSVNGQSGVVVVRATDISRTANNAETVETALARIDQKNSTQDNAISALQGDVSKIHQSIAIIADGNTHTAIRAGQAVFVKNHSTLATGLYWANSAIGTDVALTTSNLTADSNGGLNHIQDEITTLNSKITPQHLSITLLSGWSLKSWGRATAIKTGNIIVVSLSGLISDTDVSEDTAFAQIDGLSPTAFVMSTGKTNYQSGHILLSAHAGDTNIYINSSHANENNYGQLIIPVNN